MNYRKIRWVLLLPIFLVSLIGVQAQKKVALQSVLNKTSFDYSPEAVLPILEEQQKAAFMHFWKYSYNGMIHASGNTNNKNLTTGGSGFGVMTMLVGIERGWITRAQGLNRILETIEFLENADRIKGAWSHWMDKQGKPVKFGAQIEAGDVVETSFIMMGLYAAEAYFDGNNTLEVELRKKIDNFRHSIQWNKYVRGNKLYWAWDRTLPTEEEQYILPLTGYNEGLITYLLAMGAPDENAVTRSTYDFGWAKDGNMLVSNRSHYGYPWIMGTGYGGALFLSHYTFLGLNPRMMQDQFTDYMQHGIYHTMINRHYCIEVGFPEYEYDEYSWGLTACSGPKGKGYKARRPTLKQVGDDGIVAPTAAISSIIYTPYYAIQVLLNLHYNHMRLHTSDSGFADAYSIVDNWYSDECIAIDQAPMVIMIENYRSGLFWNLLKDVPDVKRGLERAGISTPVHPTGFPYAIVDTRTNEYDMVRHPDHEQYEIDIYLEQSGEAKLVFHKKGTSQVAYTTPSKFYEAGAHQVTFSLANDLDLKSYDVSLVVGGTQKATITVNLH